MTADGLRVTRPHQIMAPHVLGDIVFSGVRVPATTCSATPGRASV